MHLLHHMDDCDLTAVDLCYPHIQHTYEGPLGSKSWIDHFISSRSLAAHFINIQKLDFGANLSDHHPLSAVLQFTLHCSSQVLSQPSSSPPPRTAWHKVSVCDLTNYTHMIANSLPSFPAGLLSCSDSQCSTHQSAIDFCCSALLHCISQAALHSLPIVQKRGNSIPGWNEAARLYKSKANFWHKVWCDAGSPSSGVLFQIKKASKCRFKYEVRRLKRQQLHQRRRRMASALASSNSRNFWKEVQSVNKAHRRKTPAAPVVDGIHGDADIAKHFANKLQSLLTSASVSTSDSILDHCSCDLPDQDFQIPLVSVECVHPAFIRLKRHKNDGTGLSSDHLILALPAIDLFLADLFTSILRHGYMPSGIRDCILVPIPKGNKDPTSSDNYRPIALAPTLSKALEWVILLTYSHYFTTYDLQFGFKKHLSTSLCSAVIKNVAARFVHNGSPVFGCFLNASKAFDRVNHDILFRKLVERNLPPCLLRLLLHWYKEQKMQVCWNTSLSPSFGVSRGVRQGGVLSPILFTVYLDNLLLGLKSLGIGCHWSGHFVGAFCYADDVALLAPSPSALRLMLLHCEQFAITRGLLFNASKTQLIRFGPQQSSICSATIKFCGVRLPFANVVSHLGHYLSYDLSDNFDISMKTRDLVKKANLLLYTFSAADPVVKTHLFQSYCLSLYGCTLWNLSCPGIRSLEVAFNNILRRIWHLPYNSHTGIVHSTAHLPSISNLVQSRSSSFLCSALSCPSPIVSHVLKDSSHLAYTITGYNALLGRKHLKTVDPQYVICADVIRQIRLRAGSRDSELNDLVTTISTN